MAYKDPKDPRRVEYQKQYAKEYRKRNRQAYRDAYNRWSKENPEKNIERRKKYLSTPENRKKASARAAVYQALKKGILIRPDHCSSCGVFAKIEADHKDYDKKLDVTWLCKSCHTLVTISRKLL